MIPFWVGACWAIAHLILSNISPYSSTDAPDAAKPHPTDQPQAQAQHYDTIDIKIGFLVGSRRARNERSYLGPAKQLVHTFNYAIDKMNQEFDKNTQKQQEQGYMLLDNKQQPEQRNDTKQQSMAKIIRFVPIVAETHGNESDSIKETIGLITKHRVNFIVGPQDTCQIESRLAGAFNVGMISHYCPLYTPGLQQGFSEPPPPPPPPQHQLLTTFIHTKPPHWKIVKRAATLVSQLLSAHNGIQWYPQQLVLLYFKEPPPVSGGRQSQASAASGSDIKNKQANGSRPLNSSPGPNRRWQDQTYMANDAIQYKLIGELLEIELNQLFASSHSAAATDSALGSNRKWRQQQQPVPVPDAAPPPGAKPPLTVLNWHTTFHYGFTKNPFRQIIRRHLFRQPQPQNQRAGSNFVASSVGADGGGGAAAAANQSSRQCAASGDGEKSPQTPDLAARVQQHQTMANVLQQQSMLSGPNNRKTTAAIYIIVGHYYEHLGLMLALDELNLLGQQQQPSEKPLQSSLPVNQQQQQESLVIGVDIEQYDERDDSLRFLRGLLMDERHGSSSDLDSIANMYRNYMGVVPAKPTRMAEFLEDMRLHYNQTAALQQTQQRFPPDGLDKSSSGPSGSSWTANQTTLDSIQLTGRLFQFIRLPIEAFYLYDSIMLLGSYFNDCIQLKQLTLAQCSDGSRAFEWFRNREYVSFVDQSLTKFDSQAQTNGHYTLITRKSAISNNDTSNEPPPPTATEDGDFGLVPVGRFIESSSSPPDFDASKSQLEIELNVEADDIDPVWWPFWCQVKQLNHSSKCENLTGSYLFRQPPMIMAGDDVGGAFVGEVVFRWLVGVALVSLALIMAFAYLMIANNHTNYGRGLTSGGYVNQIGWFDEKDEENFLEIVHKFLMQPEISLNQPPEISNNAEEHQSTLLDDDQPILLFDDHPNQGPKSVVDLHCHMFPFPSCRFVHWLMALHQLKELMFQYHSSLAGEFNPAHPVANNRKEVNLESNNRNWIKSLASLGLGTARKSNSTSYNHRGFFRSKHKGTASLRILLNKYKSINQSFCNLSNLDGDNIVKLYGATLARNAAGCGERIVHLMIEQPGRGNLRGALAGLLDTMDPKATETIEFRGLVVLSSINDLINGLCYLHKSQVQFHGELMVTNCLVSSDWRLKLSGFHAFHMRRSLGNYEQKIASADLADHPQNSIYSAPEVLVNWNRRCSLGSDILKLADFYSFAFIVYELLVGEEPWACLTHVTNRKLLIERAQAEPSFRPPLSLLENKNSMVAMRIDLDTVQGLLRSCWSQSPERRPQSVDQLRLKLQKAFRLSSEAMNQSACHYVMRSYAKLLENISINRRRCLEREITRSKELRLRSLPASVVAKLCSNQPVPVQKFDCVSLCLFRFVLATDEPRPLEQLNEILIQLDALIETYRKRIHLLDSQVDSSLRHIIFSGEPVFSSPATLTNTPKKAPIMYNHCQLVASFALQLIDLANKWQSKFNSCFQVKCGLHCGPVVGGLINAGDWRPSEVAIDAELLHRHNSTGCNSTSWAPLASSSPCPDAARYVLYGSTLQMADILESTCMTQRIQVSGEFRSQILQSLNYTMGAVHEVDEFDVRSADGAGVSIGGSRQGYVMIRREAKLSSKTFGEFEAYWLLNGPRLTASQSIMLLSEPEPTNYGATQVV